MPACGPRPGTTVRESPWSHSSRLPVPLRVAPRALLPHHRLAVVVQSAAHPPSGTRPARDSACLSTSSAPSPISLICFRISPSPQAGYLAEEESLSLGEN